MLSIASTNAVVNNHTVHVKIGDADATSVAVFSSFAFVYLTSVAYLFLFASAYKAQIVVILVDTKGPLLLYISISFNREHLGVFIRNNNIAPHHHQEADTQTNDKTILSYVREDKVHIQPDNSSHHYQETILH